MIQNTDSSSYQVASLYVGDLKSDISDQVLWSVFSGFGQILSVKVCRDSTTGNSLGYAYVNFRTLEEAEKAMNALNYTRIEGKPCRIMWSMRDSQKRRSNIGNLFLKNIDVSIDSRALFEAFSVFGPIMSCKLVTDVTGKSKGFGFIQFCNEKDADTALEKANGVEFLKKKIMVTRFLTKNQRLGDNSDGKPRFTNVFCKNFGDEWTNSDLETVFNKFGPTTSCVVMNDPNGKSKGFGFVNFEKPEHAEKAVSELVDLKTPSGKPVYVARAMKKAERVELLRQEYIRKRQENMKKCQNLNVYIKPLEFEMTEEKLREHFEKFGTIISHRIMKDQTGKSRGFGFVCYSTPEEAQRAIQEMDKKVIETKPLLVTLAQTKEERRRELIAQNIGRVAGNPMYPPGSFPVMYTPQQFSQNYPHMQRFPQIPVGQRPPQRSVPPMNPQVLSNNQRGHPFSSYPYHNVQYVPRSGGRPVGGAGMAQLPPRPSIVPSQSRVYPPQYSQGSVYQQIPDPQTFRLQGMPPPSVTASMNYVTTSVNADDNKQTPVENANSIPQSMPVNHDPNLLSSTIDKVFAMVKKVYSNESQSFQVNLVNTVIDSLGGDFRRVNNEGALMDVISRAGTFLLQNNHTVSDPGVAPSVDAVSST